MNETMATLRELRIELGWSLTRLAQEAGIARPTATAAEKGEPILTEKAKAIADALTKGYGKPIKVSKIDGLNII